MFLYFPVLHWVVSFCMCGPNDQTTRQMVRKSEQGQRLTIISLYNRQISLQRNVIHCLNYLMFYSCYAGTAHGALRTERESKMFTLEQNMDTSLMENEKKFSSVDTRIFFSHLSQHLVLYFSVYVLSLVCSVCVCMWVWKSQVGYRFI